MHDLVENKELEKEKGRAASGLFSRPSSCFNNKMNRKRI
jgi:hypothetical protein